MFLMTNGICLVGKNILHIEFLVTTMKLSLWGSILSGSYKLVATNTSGQAEKEVSVSVMSEGCEGGGSEETNRPVSVSEFGVYVAQHHAQGNKMFTQVYQVSLYGYE